MNITTNNESLCQQALDPLRNVIDPEIGLNIVDLGLIYELTFVENKLVCRMTLTSQFCPMGDAIIDGVYDTLKHTFPDFEATIKLTFEPPWSQNRISEQGQLFLNQ